MRHKFVAFFALPGQLKWLFIRAIIMLPFCQLATRIFRLRYLQSLFQLHTLSSVSLSEQTTPSSQTVENSLLIQRVISRSSQLLRDNPRCLARALTGRYLLKSLGETPVLSLGAHIKGEKMAAHAWLECGGKVVTGREEMQHYTRIVSYL